MQQDKGFKVGDVVQFIKGKVLKCPRWLDSDAYCEISGKSNISGSRTMKENKGIILDITKNNTVYWVEFVDENGSKPCLPYYDDSFKLVEPKQEQYYTSIPTDVKNGDKFEIISKTGYKDNFEWAGSKDFPLGEIVTLDYSLQSNEPSFINSKGKATYLNWGCLKPVKEKEYKAGDWVLLVDKDFKSHVSATDKYKGTVQQIKRSLSKDHFQLEKCGIWSFHTSDFVKKVDGPVATAHLTDVPSTFLFGKDSLTPNEMYNFNIGDEVEYISKTGISTSFEIGDKGIIVRHDSQDNTYSLKINEYTQWVKHKQIKLVNLINTTNGKVHSTTSNDVRTAFSPDIRSKEISTGQVFSEFNLPQIWSGH